jgi:hypothetical protein
MRIYVASWMQANPGWPSDDFDRWLETYDVFIPTSFPGAKLILIASSEDAAMIEASALINLPQGDHFRLFAHPAPELLVTRFSEAAAWANERLEILVPKSRGLS